MPVTVTRRAALRGGLAGLGLAGLGAAGLTGCGGAPASTAIPEAGPAGPARRGGRMVVARPPASGAETLDPASSLSAYEYLGALYDRLVVLDDTGAAVPGLAESWESSPDARTWRFRLRRGVTFHHGRELTAADAVHTLRRILDPATSSPMAGVFAGLLEPAGLSAPDPYTLQVALAKPAAELPSLLSGYQCGVLPASGEIGVGTGPFALGGFTPAGRGSVTAHDDHWAGRPRLDEIAFASVADAQARTNALLAGQVHLLMQTNLDTATARVVASSPRTTVARSRNAQCYTVPMLATAAPFTDPVVREAVRLAYDPQAVLDTAARDAGVVGGDNPVPPGQRDWVSTLRPRDPDRARSLLRRAGADGLELDVYTSAYDPLFTPVAVAFADSLADAGIRARLVTAPADSYYTQVWMTRPLCVSYWFTGRPIDQLLNQIFRSGSSYNESAWADPRFDAMLDAARAETDAARRRTLYRDAQRYVAVHGSALTPMFADRLVGMSRDVRGYREHGFEFDYRGLGFA